MDQDVQPSRARQQASPVSAAPADRSAAARRSASATSGDTTRQTSSRLRSALVVAALLILTYLYWRLMLRWFIVQRDDFWLLSITDEPYGRFDAGEYFWRWGHDWAQRNGRSSDALVRAMLRPGAAAFSWIAPALLTAASAVLWRWLPRQLSRNPVALAMMLTVVPLILLVDARISGSTVFWAAGFGNYVVPTAMAVLAASWWVRPPRTTVALVAAALSILAASLLHELAALTVFTVANTWWLLNRGRVDRTHRWLIALAYLGVVLAFSGPGRWRRLDTLVGEETGVFRWLGAAARYTGEILLQTAAVWIALLVVLSVSVAALWARLSVADRRWLLASTTLAWVGAVAALLLARQWRPTGQTCGSLQPMAAESRVPALLMLIAAVVTLVALAVALLRLRGSLGDTPVLLGSGALATLPIPLLTGLCAARVWYPTLVWLGALVAVLLATLVARRLLPVAVLVAAAAVGTLGAGWFAAAAEPALRANHESFAAVIDQIEGTRADGTGVITFPEDVPHPEYGHAPVFRLPSIACGFRTYYEVPEQVILDNGRQPEAGLPAYCPRPDAVQRN